MSTMGDRKEDDAINPVTWEELPSEVVGQVMKHLDIPDLKSCRLLNKITASEAAPYLFSTLRAGPDDSSFERAEKYTKLEVAKYIRCLEFQGSEGGDSKRLTCVMLDLQCHRITSVSLVGLGLGETLCFLFCAKHREQRRALLTNVTKMTITFKRIKGTGTLYTHFADPIGKVAPWASCALSEPLSQLQELEIGFSGIPNYHQPAFSAQKSLSDFLLRLKLDKLRSLTLLDVPTSPDELVETLKRQKTTLRSLTLRNVYLCCAVEGECPEIGKLVRFILLLNKELQLDHMSLQGELQVGDPVLDYKVYCRQAGDATVHGPAAGSLRQNIEDFICHRGDFPFPVLEPYASGILDESIESHCGTFWFDRGGGAGMYLTPETDDTFQLPRPLFH